MRRLHHPRRTKIPIIAVAGAVAGASAIAAGGLTVWGTISAIGGIIGGIGALTGNEAMMKIGGIASLAGGVGGFATGQGWLASDPTAGAGEAGNIKAMTSTTAPGMENVNPTVAASAQATPGAGGALMDSGATANLSSGTQNITQANSLVTDGGLGSITDAGIIGSPLTAGPGAASAPLPTGPGGFSASLGQTTLGAGARNMGFDGSMGGASEGGIFGTLKKFSSFLNENKELTSMAGNFIGGMFDDRKKAETELLKARADTERQQLLNGSAVPNMNLKLKPNQTVFRPGAPTYNAPRPGSLFYAK